jgi:hypothetical protein
MLLGMAKRRDTRGSSGPFHVGMLTPGEERPAFVGSRAEQP